MTSLRAEDRARIRHARDQDVRRRVNRPFLEADPKVQCAAQTFIGGQCMRDALRGSSFCREHKRIHETGGPPS